jgi:hypothetical protein
VTDYGRFLFGMERSHNDINVLHVPSPLIARLAEIHEEVVHRRLQNDLIENLWALKRDVVKVLI